MSKRSRIIVPGERDTHDERGLVFRPRDTGTSVHWDQCRNKQSLDDAYVRVDLGERYYVPLKVFLIIEDLVAECRVNRLPILPPSAYHRLKSKLFKQHPTLAQ